jgi:AICAR transformylase/IMP cyclohydrolase PurH
MKIALPAGGATDWDNGRNAIESKRIGSGLLLQTSDNHEAQAGRPEGRDRQAAHAEELQDLLFAWNVAKYVKSNAIVFCKNGMTMGVGAGQMSRLDSARIASIKAEAAKLSLQAPSWRRMPSSPSATAWTWWSMQAPPAWPSPAAPCATGSDRCRQRAWRGHGVHRRAPLQALIAPLRRYRAFLSLALSAGGGRHPRCAAALPWCLWF